MTLHGGQVSYQTDVGRRVKSSLRQHIGRIWLSGALFTGGMISLLPARERKVYVNPLTKDGKGKLAAVGKPAKWRIFPVPGQGIGADCQTDPYGVYHEAVGLNGGRCGGRAEVSGADHQRRRTNGGNRGSQWLGLSIS